MTQPVTIFEYAASMVMPPHSRVDTSEAAGTRAALIWIGVVIVGLLGMSLIAAQLANGG